MTAKNTVCTGGLCFEEIGYWSEVKLDIIRKYAQAYSRILSKQQLKHAYIDAFAGSGVHLTKGSRTFVPGSPLNALRVDPPFHEYFLIDLDGDKVDQLKGFPEVEGRTTVHVIHGDCNRVLLDEVFPKVKYEDYRRALCVLDPYGLHLNWDVIETAGKMKSMEIFLNFPIMDMNRNALWREPGRTSPEGLARMTAFWGDDSWRQAAYQKQATLFGRDDDIKLGNRDVVEAFRSRLISAGGFKHVPEPLPMRNSTNAEVYYLFFASQKPVASKIFQKIVEKYKDRMA